MTTALIILAFVGCVIAIELAVIAGAVVFKRG